MTNSRMIGSSSDTKLLDTAPLLKRWWIFGKQLFFFLYDCFEGSGSVEKTSLRIRIEMAESAPWLLTTTHMARRITLH